MVKNIHSFATKAFQSVHSYPNDWYKEDTNTRIARDVFIYKRAENTGELLFLCKYWDESEHHRARPTYGNAFGSFLCRPPRNAAEARLDAPYIKKCFNQVWTPPTGTPSTPKRSLMVSAQLPHFLTTKQDRFNSTLGNINSVFQPFSDTADTFLFQIPSKKQRPGMSSLSAPMSCIAKFFPMHKYYSDLSSVLHDGTAARTSHQPLVWVSAKIAASKHNAHNCVIKDYLQYVSSRKRGSFLRQCFSDDSPQATILNGSNIKDIQQCVQTYVDHQIEGPIRSKPSIPSIPNTKKHNKQKKKKKKKKNTTNTTLKRYHIRLL